MPDLKNKTLFLLFFTEMWARFSYYGMRALLILYLVKALHYSDRTAGLIYGSYTGLVYLTPLFGGYLADKYLGYSKSIILGGILMICGHLSLAMDTIPTFFLGLSLLVLGNGFFKPNISTLLGYQYRHVPEKKDSAFTIFYMGINLGAAIGPILCGYLGETFGWHYGFGVAAFGMLLGLLQFMYGLSSLEEPPTLSVKSDTEKLPLQEKEKKHIIVICILAFFSIFFWFAYEQAGSSISLFIDRHIDRNVLGYNIPASIFQSINPILILLLAPLFSYTWNSLRTQNKEPDTLSKLSLGMLLLGLGFVVLVYGASELNPSTTKVNIIWVLLMIFLHTLGELSFSPVGLSMVSKMAPIQYASLLMGIWFLSSAIAHYSAGILSGYMKEFGSPSTFFTIFIISSFFMTGLIYLLSPGLRKMMK